MSFFSFEREKIKTPEEYKIFYRGEMPDRIRESLIETYQEIFAEHPWNEDWSREDVLQKIKDDMEKDAFSFVVVFHEEDRVKGFSWGTIIAKEEVLVRASRAMKIPREQIKIETLLKNEKVLYLDEFALARDARKGVDPVRHILKKFLQYGHDKRVKITLFWSTPSSKIVPLAEAMGYEKCGKTFSREKEIVFLINRDFRPLLKATKNLPSEWIQKILSIQKRRRARKK